MLRDRHAAVTRESRVSHGTLSRPDPSRPVPSYRSRGNDQIQPHLSDARRSRGNDQIQPHLSDARVGAIGLGGFA